MLFINFVNIVLLFINIVKSSDVSDKVYRQIHTVSRVVRDVNKYKDPPEKAIPVAIIFDDNGDRERKSFDTSSKSNDNIVSENKTSDNNNPTLIKLSSDFSVKSSDESTAKVKSPGTNIIPEEGLQIPVAVVYEKEPTTIKSIAKVLRRSKLRNQGQLNRHREQNVVNVTESNKNIATSTEKIKETKNIVSAEGTKSRKESRERDPVVPIIQSENKVFGHSGDFHYSYEGGDGTKAFEMGELKSFENDKTGEAVVGGFSYTDKDGKDFSLSYTADENGYRPVGAHLPTPPPIPPAIERALRYLATKTTPEPVTDPIVDSKEDSK